MKYFFTYLPALMLGLGMSAESLEIDSHVLNHFEHLHRDRVPGPETADYRKYAPDRLYDVRHVEIDVTPDFERRTVSGRTTIRFKPIAAALPELRLDAVDLTVTRVETERSVRAWQNTDEALIVTFEEPIPAGEEVELIVHHSAEPKKGMYFRTPAMGYKAGESHLFTQGEPHEARHWYPCFDYPNEMFTSEVVCRVPEGMIVLSNGRKLSEELDETSGLVAFRWLQDKPHVNYLISVVAGYFSKVEDRYRDIPMAFYTPPSQIEQAAHSFEETKEMMVYFEKEIGVPYPWDKYDQVCVNDFVAGGMENTSLTTLTDGTLFTSATENLRSSRSLVAHELAHQWFGDLVTCKDWSHLWLNEGFATYYDALFEGHKEGEDGLRYRMYVNASRFIDQPNDKTPIAFRKYKDAMEQFSYRAYPKGAWVLHMLRSQLGAGLFRECVKTYLERHRYGVVDTEDLNAVLEESTGRSFDRFFDQWVYHAGHPDLKIKYAWDEKIRLAKLSIRQEQEASEDVFLFRFPLKVRFKGEFGVREREIEIKHVAEDFYFSLPEAPEIVRVDPDYALLARIDLDLPKGLIHAQLVDGDDMMGRLLAAKSLGKSETKEAIEKLKAALKEDSFHGVRIEASKALREIHTDEALAALLECVEQDDARVRLQVVKDIGGFYDESAYEYARGVVAREKNPDIAASAINDLGGYGDVEIKGLIRDLLDSVSYRNVLANSAIAAARSQDDPDFVMPVLEVLMKREAEFTTRSFARGLDALAHLARNESDRAMVREFITTKLRHPKDRVRRAAIEALGTLGDPRAVAPLLRFAGGDSEEPESKAADTAIKKLRAGRKPVDELRILRNEVMELQKVKRDLEKRMDTLEEKVGALNSEEDEE